MPNSFRIGRKKFLATTVVLPLPHKQCNFTCRPTRWFGGILHGKKTSTTYTWQMPSVTLLDTTTSAKPFTPSSRRDARRLFLAAWDSADILEKSPSRQLNAMVRPIYKNKIFFYKYRHIQVSRYIMRAPVKRPKYFCLLLLEFPVSSFKLRSRRT